MSIVQQHERHEAVVEHERDLLNKQHVKTQGAVQKQVYFMTYLTPPSCTQAWFIILAYTSCWSVHMYFDLVLILSVSLSAMVHSSWQVLEDRCAKIHMIFQARSWVIEC